MKHFRLALIILTVFVLSPLLVSQNQSKRPAPSVEAETLYFDVNNIDMYGNLRVFVPTGSTNSRCLVTFNDSNWAPFVTPVFCGARTFGGMKGVLLNITFTQPVPYDFTLSLTLYQEGARYYGQQVPYGYE